MAVTSFALDRLIAPIDTETFFSEYYEKKPLLIQRGDPAHYEGLLSLDDIDHVVTTMQLSHPDIQLVDAKNPDLKEPAYTYPSGLVDVVSAYKAFEDGATVILPQLHNHVPALSHLCRSMERQLSSRFQTNIYMTPGGEAQGFNTHYDSHDVFVLQVAGHKHWKVYGTPVELPYRGQAFDPHGDVEVGDITMEFELEQGDLLYLPRGIMHDAYTEDGLSLHITLGVLITSWTDLLVESIARVGLKDADFRRGLPPGFAKDEYDRDEARSYFKSLLEKVVESADFDSVLDHFAEDLVSTRHPLLRGQMSQMAKSAELDADSTVGCRPDLVYRMTVADGQVQLRCYGNEISLPDYAEAPMRFAIETPKFRVGDLPGELDDPGKVVLVKRLVREGLVEVL